MVTNPKTFSEEALQELRCRNTFLPKAKTFLTEDCKCLATCVTLHKYHAIQVLLQTCQF